jgi:hypothetical protein
MQYPVAFVVRFVLIRNPVSFIHSFSMERRPTARKSSCAPLRRSRSVPRQPHHIRFLANSVRSRSVPPPDRDAADDEDVLSDISLLYRSSRHSFHSARAAVEDFFVEPYRPFNDVLHVGDSDALSDSSHGRSPEPRNPAVPIGRRSSLDPFVSWDLLRKEAAANLRLHRFFSAALVSTAIYWPSWPVRPLLILLIHLFLNLFHFSPSLFCCWSPCKIL